METRGGFYISRIKQLQDRIFEKLLHEKGIEIGGGQGRILFVLWKKDNLLMSEISKETSLAKNTVSIIIDGMVEKGIVVKTVNPNNRRQTIISLTDYAKALEEEFAMMSDKMGEIFYRGFTEKEQKEFEAYLFRILDTLTAFEERYDDKKSHF